MNNSKQNVKWTLITIVDPKCLPGKSIFDSIQVISKVINFEFVILDDIYGAAGNGLILSLQERENEVLKLTDFLKVVCKVKQFDWGNFFLFKEYPMKWNNSEKDPYPYVIAQTDTTIRAVDDGYIYVYTPHQDIINIIKESYEIESIKTDSLDNLDYPE